MITYIRHGQRRFAGGTEEEAKAWLNSKRKEQNAADEPLTETGKKELIYHRSEFIELY